MAQTMTRETTIEGCKALYSAFQKDIENLLEEGMHGWVIYAWSEGRIVRHPDTFPTLPAGTHIAEDLYGEGNFIVQALDADPRDAFSSITYQ